MPATALVAMLSLKLLAPLPGEAMLAGENVAVTPLGSPLIENAMADRNPPSALVARLRGVVLPVDAVSVEASARRLKLGLAATTRVIELERARPPPLPLTVTV